VVPLLGSSSAFTVQRWVIQVPDVLGLVHPVKLLLVRSFQLL
jgi:hypothetical protein